jgi:hypothetical protein
VAAGAQPVRASAATASDADSAVMRPFRLNLDVVN